MAVGIVMAAGCSSNGGGLAVHPSSHPTTPASPHPSASSTAIPTGTQLGKMLAGAHLPAGWTHAQGAGSGIEDSGSANMAGTGPEPAEYACKYLDSSLQAAYIINWWSSSYASLLLIYPSESANLPQVTVTVGAYAPGDAAKNMARAGALMARCRSFRDPGIDNDRDTTSVKTIPHLGDRNLFLTSREYTSNAGTLTAQLLLIQDGSYILGVDTNTAAGGNVRPATVQGFGGWLVQLLRSRSLA
jgi:hypothetical protein